MRIIAILFSLVFLSACGATRPAEPWKCALVGGTIGGLAGTATGASVADDDDDTTDSTLIGAGAGGLAGLAVGYTICALMPERVAEAPPAPPVKHVPVVKKTVVLPGVNFGFDRSDLLAPAKATLDKEIIPELKADQGLTVSVEGHTDAVGSDQYNQTLSNKRAQTVRDYLISQGIEPSRIEAVGFGETRPIESNDTEAGRAANRRVEVKELQ
jgi:OOP family OmpA-OmpF porin